MKTPPRAPIASLFLFVAAASLAGCSRPRVENPRPTIVVEVRCPGANARVVADTIAAPIEQQMSGVDKMLTMRSRSSDDGLCTITVTFAPGVELSAGQALVEHRIKQALPGLPDVVKRGGVVVRKGSTGVGLILFLSSPNGRFDKLYLSNYANTQLKDQLARTAGVADVTLVGSQEYSLRIWLDPDRLAALELAATDVMKVLERQNLKPAAAPVEPAPGKSPAFEMTVSGLGRLATVEELNDLVVQADAGREIRLRDIARVQLGAAHADSRAQLDGKPGVAMVIHLLPFARPGDVSAALQQMMTRRASNFPEGTALDIAFDFTTNLEAAERATSPQYVLLDMDAPPGASAERKLATLERADQVMRLGKQIKRVMSLTDNVFDRLPDRPCVVVRVDPARRGQSEMDTMIEAIRRQLEKQVAEAAFRLRDLSRPSAFPRCGYPIDFALHGPDGNRARSFARKLAERLRASGKLTDVWTGAEAADRTRVQLDVDASAAKAHGVALTDVVNTVQVFFGGLELNGSGQSWQINLQTGSELHNHADDIKQLKVRNSGGEFVPLSRLVTLREITGPSIEERLNGQPMVEITANPASGKSLAEIRTLCETLAGDVRAELRLIGDYRLTWLDDPSAAK
jgi:multidrug efflux pump subunit AcrB